MAFTVIGHQRSGSSFLNELIRVHSAVEALHEPFMQHLHLFRDTDLVPWDASTYSPNQLHPDIAPGGAMEEYLMMLRDWLHAPTDTVRGFKEVALFEKLGWFSQVFEPLTGVVLARDPRSVANSVLRRSMHESWWDYSGRLRANPSLLEHIPDDLDPDDGLVATAAVWSIRMGYALDHAASAGWLVVRLEDLFADPEAWLEALMSHIGVEVEASQMAFLQSSWSETRDGVYSFWRTPEAVLDAWKENLNDDDQEVVRRIAGREMVRLGYTD